MPFRLQNTSAHHHIQGKRVNGGTGGSYLELALLLLLPKAVLLQELLLQQLLLLRLPPTDPTPTPA